MRRLLTAAVLASACTAVVPAAHAASLVYVDAGRDIAVARPDGSLARKITHTTDPSGFKAPSVADDGGITAFIGKDDDNGNSSFVVLGQDGTVRQGPFLFEKYGICGGLSPFWSATSPDGTFVAVSYWKGSSSCLGGSVQPSIRLANRNAPTIGTSTYPSWDYLNQPRWVRHPDARLAAINGGTLSVWQNDATRMSPWIALPNDSGLEVDGFDFHPTDTRLLIDVAASGGTGVQPHRLELYSYTEFSTGGATPTDPAPQLLCAADGYVTNDRGGGHPVWSPDGSQIAWSSSDGIYVSPAPVVDGGTCRLQPTLVVPGGAQPAWARFDVTAPDPGTGGGGTGGGGTGTGGGGTTGTGSGGGTSTGTGTGTGGGTGTAGGTGTGGTTGTGGGTGTTKPAPAVFSAATALGAKRAFTVRLKLAKASVVTVTVSRLRARTALGSVRYTAPRGPFTRKITKLRGRKLAAGSYKVVIRAGTTTKTLTVRVR